MSDLSSDALVRLPKSPFQSLWRQSPWLLVVLVEAWIAMYSAIAFAQSSGGVGATRINASNAQFETSQARAHLSFVLDRLTPVKAFVLSSPDRVIVDVAEMNFQNFVAPKDGQASKGLVKSFRFGQLTPGQSRIVFDLAEPAKIVIASCEPLAGGRGRLTIELEKTDRAQFATTAAAAVQNHAALVAESLSPTPVNVPGNNRPVIVLDPGHGGIDSGATNGNSVLEKVIVLEFAKVLQAKLNADGKFNAILTREDDRFVPLDERVRFAKNAGAKLFISIHADTLNESTTVQGATIYIGSEQASDAESARIAEKENRVDQLAGLDKATEKVQLDDILADLTRRETRTYSRYFAHVLVNTLQNYMPLNKNPERSAAFRVLRAADIPSALIELGYLSNPRDVEKLVSENWRQNTATGFVQAINQYFDQDQATGALASGAKRTGNSR